MKKLLISLVLVSASFAYAMPNPQYIPLDNIAQFGTFIEANMGQIVQSSVALAMAAVPESHYFLVTQSVVLTPYGRDVEQGKKPFATLTMESGPLRCERDIYSTVSANQWGENRVLTFTMAPGIRCEKK